MQKKETKKMNIKEIERRLLRVEVLVWILCGINGLKFTTEMIPVIQAMIN